MASVGDYSGVSNTSLFYHCIQGLLKSWTALQLAVSHSFAGPHSKEKAQWLVGVIEAFFKENTDLEPYEVEDFLEEIMSNEFNLVAEDNSIKEISIELCKLFHLWDLKKIDEMKSMVNKLPCVNLGECMYADQNSEIDTLNEDATIKHLNITGDDKQCSNDNKQTANASKEDNDGWIHVSRKKRH